MDQVNPKPRNLAALVRARLEEIERWLDYGVSRQEISLILKNESGFDVTDKAFEMALYRARKKRKSVMHNTENSDQSVNVLHNTDSKKPDNDVLHNTDESEEVEKPEPRGILDKKFFDEVNAFDPKQFNDKYKWEIKSSSIKSTHSTLNSLIPDISDK